MARAGGRVVVRAVAALATTRAVVAWTVRLEPPWPLAVAVGIAVALVLAGSSSPRTKWAIERRPLERR